MIGKKSTSKIAKEGGLIYSRVKDKIYKKREQLYFICCKLGLLATTRELEYFKNIF